MVAVLIKAFSFVLIICIGYILKKVNFFKTNDHRLISKIVINLTLPAAVITAFSNFERDISLFILVGIGLLLNLLMLGFGYAISKRKDSASKALYMLNLPGYNIGCFAMPFAQGFLGPMGVIAASMFDAGNAIMCTGGSYAVTSSIVNADSKLKIKTVGKKLLSSTPFCTYALMLLISAVGISLPRSIITIASPIASANGFLAMLMIGMMIEIKFEAEHIKTVSTTILVRFLFACALSAVFYFLTPFSLLVRQVLAIIVFAPIPSLSPVFTELCGGDSALSSFANSLSVLVSIVAMICLIIVMRIGM